MRAFCIALISSTIISMEIFFSAVVFLYQGSSRVYAQESSNSNNTGANNAESGVLEDTPLWLHTYPGSDPQIVLVNKTEGTVYINFEFTTGDSVDSVIDYYKKEMQAAGLPASDDVTQDYNGVTGKISTNASVDPRIKILAQSSRGAKTKVEVIFSQDVNALATRKSLATPTPDISDVRWRDGHKLLTMKEFFIDITLIMGMLFILFVWISQLVQCSRIEEDVGTRRLWIVIILLTNFIGAVVYFLVRRPQRIVEVGR